MQLCSRFTTFTSKLVGGYFLCLKTQYFVMLSLFQPSSFCLSSSFCIYMSLTSLSGSSHHSGAQSSFFPLLMVGITLGNTATRQPRVFPLLPLDKGLSLMPLGPLGKPGSSILMRYHPRLWLSQRDDVIVERRDVMAPKTCLCEDALQKSSCSAHTDVWQGRASRNDDDDK